ncbi:MAG: hypothetical protein LBO09_00810 [Candidatus Peribacteria bacterium]|nr:hypothetical protein [Candidatus Peribacteria bacterium]
MTSNPESKDFIRDLSTDKVRDLSKKISLDGDNFTTPEDIQKKESLLASLQNIIEEKEDASALNADLEKIFEAFLKSEAISTLPQNPTFSQILTVFNEWKCPADVVLSFSAVDIKNYVCDLLELNDQKQQEIEKAVAEAKDAENPLKQQILENTKSIQDKIDANQQRIDELNGLITNHDATIQATIDREKAKGKNFTSQQINDYKKSLESVKATREIKKAQLIAQNQKLTQALQDSKLLEKSEADVQRHVASVEVSKDSDKSSEDWVSQANEGLEVVSVSKNPKNDKKALKWMIQGKEGFTLRFTLMDDPDLPETEKKEKLKAEKENLDKLYASTKKLDLPTVVKWLDAQTWTTEEELQNKVKTTYAGKHKGKVSDFAGFYADLHINGAEKSLANQLMQHLVQGARAGMSAIKIFNTKREVDLVNKALDEQLEKAQEQEQKSQEWLTPSEKKLIGMLADLDANGKVAGVGGEKQKKNNRIDAGNVMGTQILSAYQSAKMQLGVEKGADTEEANKILIQNLFSLLLTQREKIYKDDLSFNSRLE